MSVPKHGRRRFPPQPQGVAPLAKPLRTLCRCQQSVARCFHGLLVLGHALARPAAPKSHGCLVSGEPVTRASRSPTGEPEGRQPPSPMVPIDSAERSRRFGLQRVRLAERRADTEVPTRARGEDAALRPHLSAQRPHRHELPKDPIPSALCCARVSQSVPGTRTVTRTS